MVEVLSRGVGPATTIDRFLGASNRVDVADRRVFEELRRAPLGPRSIYMVGPQHAARVLRLLEGLPIADSRGAKQIQFRGTITPELTDERHGGRVRLRLRWLTPEGAELQLATVPWTVYEDFPPLLLIGNGIFRAPERMLCETFRRLLAEPIVDFEVGELAQSVSRLESLLAELQLPSDWLNQRLLTPPSDSPKFRVVLSFAAPALHAEATVHVGPHTFPLTGNEDTPDVVWLPADESKWATRVQRDRNAEREAAKVLRDAGFICRAENSWEISGDDALDLVRRELAPLIGKFELFWVAAPKANMFRQTASFEAQPTAVASSTHRGASSSRSRRRKPGSAFADEVKARSFCCGSAKPLHGAPRRDPESRRAACVRGRRRHRASRGWTKDDLRCAPPGPR